MRPTPAVLLAIGLVAAGIAGASVVGGEGTDALVCDGCNVVFVQVDMMRPDHMGAYGYDRNTTPTIDALADDSFVFTRQFAQSRRTVPGTVSLLTGRHVSTHRVTPATLEEEPPVELEGLPELFRSAGYLTYGSIDTTLAATFRGPMVGPGRHGFQELRIRESDIPPDLDGSDERFNISRIGQVIDRGAARDRPVFLYLETQALHFPYFADPADEYRFLPDGTAPSFRERTRRDLERYNRSMALWRYRQQLLSNETHARYAVGQYDAILHRIDQQLQRVFDRLRAAGTWDETIVVVTASHGESLGDHDLWRHISLRNEVLHVPLVIRVPGNDGRRIDRYTANVDVEPTLRALAGLDDSAGVEGVSLLPAMLGRELDRRYILAEFQDEQAVLIDTETDIKYYDPETYHGERLYNLSSDLAEEHPFNDTEIVRRMRDRLQEYYDSVPAGRVDEGEAPWPYFS